MSENQLTQVQASYALVSSAKGFDSFVKLFEISGYEPEQAKNLAEKEAYHLAQLLVDSKDLQNMPPASLVMEMRKLPMMGLSLDPSLGLAYLLIQDKGKGKVSLEATGRGRAVQAIAQNIIKNVNVEIIFEGDKVERVNGLLSVTPEFKEKAKVIGGIITIDWPNGKTTQEVFRQSHIESWKARSAKRFGNANANYTSFNGGPEPGFVYSKVLKHKLSRLGINFIPVKQDRIQHIAETLQDAGHEPSVITDVEVVDETEQTLNQTQPVNQIPSISENF